MASAQYDTHSHFNTVESIHFETPEKACRDKWLLMHGFKKEWYWHKMCMHNT